MQENNEQKVNEIEIDLQELLMSYLRKWWLIAICVVVAAAAAFVLTKQFVTPTYRADISIYVNNDRGTESKDYLSNADLYAAQNLVNTYVSIAKSDRVLERIADTLGGDYTAEGLARAISASQLNETEIFRIYAVHENPAEAARIANAAALVAPEEIAGIIEGTSARVIDTAKIPTSHYTPNYGRALIIGAAIGLVAALAFLTVLFLQDTRIKDEDDLTNMFSLPILGRIPEFSYTPSSESSYGYGSAEETKKVEEESQA